MVPVGGCQMSEIIATVGALQKEKARREPGLSESFEPTKYYWKFLAALKVAL
jgi:hypothetical protein